MKIMLCCSAGMSTNLLVSKMTLSAKQRAIDCEIEAIPEGEINSRLKEADVFKDEEPLTYAYYQSHKEELTKITTEEGTTAWKCNICGYIYYGEKVPDDFICPICGAEKYDFQIVEE